MLMQIPELAAKVQSLGLTDKEAKVYVASLFLGPSPVQKIAQQADVNRATAYVILDQLAELGLVAQSTEGKKTVYIAEGPELLHRVFDRQELEIEERRKELKLLLPELELSQRAHSGAAPIVKFYKGERGVAALVQELHSKTPKGSEIYSLMNGDEVEKVNPGAFKSNPTTRLKKNVSSKVIYSYEKEIKSDSKLLRDTKKIDNPVLADISLHEGIASLSTYKGKSSVGVIIESKEIVGALRQLFELAWGNKDQ